MIVINLIYVLVGLYIGFGFQYYVLKGCFIALKGAYYAVQIQAVQDKIWEYIGYTVSVSGMFFFGYLIDSFLKYLKT